MDLKRKLKTLFDERTKLLDDQKTMNDRAIAEKRDLTADELLKYGKMDACFEKLSGQIGLLREQIESESTLPPELKSEIIHDDNNVPPIRTRQGGIEYRSGGKETMKLERRLLGDSAQYFKDNAYSWNPEGTSWRDLMNTLFMYGENYVRARFGPEGRALQVDKDTSGGYLTAPQFTAQLIKTLDNRLEIRQRARKFVVESSDQLDFPELADDPGNPDWTSEIQTGSEDSTMDFAKRSFHAHPLARRIKVSNKLMRLSVIPPEELIRERLADVFENVLENNYLNGDGANKPLGLFTANDAGIPTSRDCSTGMTSSTIKADGLINARGELKSQYRKNACWVMHRDAETAIRKLKDGEGNYIWQNGLQEGAPNMLLGHPVVLSEWAPSTFSASEYIALLGDLSYYWIFDSLQFSVQVLHELYAEENRIGIIARYEGDSAPIVSDAFVRVQFAA